MNFVHVDTFSSYRVGRKISISNFKNMVEIRILKCTLLERSSFYTPFGPVDTSPAILLDASSLANIFTRYCKSFCFERIFSFHDVVSVNPGNNQGAVPCSGQKVCKLSPCSRNGLLIWWKLFHLDRCTLIIRHSIFCQQTWMSTPHILLLTRLQTLRVWLVCNTCQIFTKFYYVDSR